MSFAELNYTIALPEIFMTLMAFVMLVFGAFGGSQIAPSIKKVTVASFAFAALMICVLENHQGTGFNGLFISDTFADYLKILIALGASFSILISKPYLNKENIMRFEYPILVLMSVIGMFVMVSANDLLTLYLGLELQSLSLYVLAAINRNNLKSSEAGLKYFILGALSSGLLLFGSSIIYGYTGTTGFDSIALFISSTEALDPVLIVGLVFVLSGLAFKISAVPFHMWTPDVYEGVPTSVTAFFAIVPKIAALGLIARVIAVPLGETLDAWQQIMIFLSVASMTVGAFAALVQDNLKRLLAYSSIGNMGYALIGLTTGTHLSFGAALIYMTIYMIMTAGTFAIILSLQRDGTFLEKVSDLAGLSKTQPIIAYIMAVMMFSMAGIPPLAGFFGKWVVFQAAVDAGLFWLAVYGIVTSVVAAYYYLRIVKVMFFEESENDHDQVTDWGRRSVMYICTIFILFFILNPDLIFNPARIAAESIMPAE